MRRSITGVTTNNRVERIEHGDVDDCHRPAGATGPQLFSENAVFPKGDRGMIETARINRDYVPAVKRIEALPRAYKRRNVGSGVKQRTECRTKSLIEHSGEGRNR